MKTFSFPVSFFSDMNFMMVMAAKTPATSSWRPAVTIITLSWNTPPVFILPLQIVYHHGSPMSSRLPRSIVDIWKTLASYPPLLVSLYSRYHILPYYTQRSLLAQAPFSAWRYLSRSIIQRYAPFFLVSRAFLSTLLSGPDGIWRSPYYLWE